MCFFLPPSKWNLWSYFSSMAFPQIFVDKSISTNFQSLNHNQFQLISIHLTRAKMQELIDNRKVGESNTLNCPWLSGPERCWRPTSRTSDCAPELALFSWPLQANSWICCPQRAKKREAQNKFFATQRGTHRMILCFDHHHRIQISPQYLLNSLGPNLHKSCRTIIIFCCARTWRWIVSLAKIWPLDLGCTWSSLFGRYFASTIHGARQHDCTTTPSSFPKAYGQRVCLHWTWRQTILDDPSDPKARWVGRRQTQVVIKGHLRKAFVRWIQEGLIARPLIYDSGAMFQWNDSDPDPKFRGYKQKVGVPDQKPELQPGRPLEFEPNRPGKVP